MQKTLGILALLVFVCVVTAIGNRNFLTPYNLENQFHWAALYGIISLGAAFVIIGGGIDLSIGSVIGLIGCLLPFLLVKHGFTIPVALASVLGLSLVIGLVHGVLIVHARLQPFVVTLCGMLFYRGIARWITRDDTLGFGEKFQDFRQLAIYKIPVTPRPGDFRVPITLLFLVALGVVSMVLLNQTVFGRHLQALGRNEQAARYSGINTGRLTILSYVICAFLAGLGGVLLALDVNAVQPATQGLSYEFYAIAAAVLGGCSLRGGEGTILGVIFGAALLQLLRNSLNLLGIQDTLVAAVIGVVILCGVLVDEAIRRVGARRLAVQK